MLSKAAVQEKEECIREWVRQLPDDKRRAFFNETEKKLKDPDTYATLNYILIAGLHHFYLGKWMRGFVNISIFLLGVMLLFTDHDGMGLLLIAGIIIFELNELFMSQVIVQDYNNKVMENIYRDITNPNKSVR